MNNPEQASHSSESNSEKLKNLDTHTFNECDELFQFAENNNNPSQKKQTPREEEGKQRENQKDKNNEKSEDWKEKQRKEKYTNNA